MTPDRSAEIARFVKQSTVVRSPWLDNNSLSSGGKPDYIVCVRPEGLGGPSILGRGPNALAALTHAFNSLTEEPEIVLGDRPRLLVDPAQSVTSVTLTMVQGDTRWTAASDPHPYNNGNLPQVAEQAGYAAVRKGFLEALSRTQPVQTDPSKQTTADIMAVHN